MNREDIAERISRELLITETLDIHNFIDADAALEYVKEIILKHLQDYMIVSGSLL